MAGKRCSCRVKPRTVSVAGHWRELSGKKKRRKPAARKPPARYWRVVDDRGHSCGHHHKTISGALACVRRHDRAERAKRARLTRRQARATKLVRWRAEAVSS